MHALTRIAFLAGFSVLSLFSIPTQASAVYSNLYAFGDSLTDVGNVYLATGGLAPTSAYYTDGSNVGRFTNGLNYLDVLAAKMGLGVAPLYSGGTDYAFGGARVASAPSGLPSFNQQIGLFDASHAVADPNALYVLWIGANDMTDAIKAAATGDTSAIGTAIVNSMTGIDNAIGNLSGLGAKHFLVMNLPDLALTPGINGYGNSLLDSLANMASTTFNQNLALLLNNLGGPDILQFDVYAALNDVVANPGSYGLTNVTDSCYTGEVDGSSLNGNPVTVCSDPSQYAFWDYEHPTAALHQTLGNMAYAAVSAHAASVPEPSSVALLCLSLGGLALVLRRKASAPTGAHPTVAG
jgi:phospholipase/lecithinase/hemolysin